MMSFKVSTITEEVFEKMKCLKPEFYNEFVCLANRCTYTCCMDWNIHMSKEEVGRLHEYYGDHLDIHEDGGATLRFGKDGTCEMMNEEGLCTLYLQHGVEGISAVCDTYPRFAIKYDDVQEFHLSNGCEGVLSYFMKRPQLTFLEEDDQPFKTMIEIYPKETGMIAARNHAIDLMQIEGIPVWIKLYLVLKYAGGIKACSDIEGMIRDFSNESSLRMMAEQLAGIPDNYSSKFGMFYEMLNSFLPKVREKHSYELNIKELESEIPGLLGDTENLVMEYMEFRKALAQYESYFENVCANYLYTHVEYMFDKDKIEDCVQVLLLQYGITGMSTFLKWKRNNKRISDMDIMHITAFFARMMEHGIEVMTEFMDNNSGNEWFTDAGFLTFIR